ncbi:uncharacterized protein BYT42DRAFT_493724 [Radiomyces spectabilis]|uniref:uncharacterized protein n=1 Tax=Radiomyces spectabilis TaxID=64574 RepID=UPI00221FD703|nr:uncharacterized protein BYT42DRAFT_493724 [Radiomyces spectabilis]KAI8384613.1 hypothetical protein BYT42DRAFT_493724 [Radiomyces spectabilis]
MISLFTALIVVAVIIPCIPILIYVIGLLLPASHIVSRTAQFTTTADHLWHILTNVQQYPEWQTKLERVTVNSTETDSSPQEERLIFTEHTKRKRRIVVIHVIQKPYRKLLRILEEQAASTHTSPPSSPSRKPSFSGSWTFEIIPSDEKELAQPHVTLKITQQGVIKKPMVRVSHLLLFGFYRRIDRFLKDIGKKIEEDQSKISTESLPEEVEEEQPQLQPIHPSDTPMLESTVLEKDWDMMSEIYDRKAT